MNIWWTMLISDILIPLVMIVCGFLMFKFPPKKINSFIGYRTSRSMRSVEAWKFAQKHSAKLMFIVGLILLIPSVLIIIPFYHQNENIVTTVGMIIMVVQLVILICTIIPTEKALKRIFK